MLATLSLLVLSLIATGPSPSQDDCASMLPK